MSTQDKELSDAESVEVKSEHTIVASKKRERKLTIKQAKAISLIAENGGNVSKAMREAGYSKISAATPKKLTESLGYKNYADRIPDELLEKTHLEGLQAKQFRYSPKGKLIQLDDFAVRYKYMDSGYKLKGSYVPEKSQSIHIQVNLENRQYIEGVTDKVTEQLLHDELQSNT